MSDRTPSKADEAEAYLREQIRTGALEPGQFIDKAAICIKLGVSRQPVTTALIALAREGLVDIRPQLGSYVAKPDGRPREISQETAREMLAALKAVVSVADRATQEFDLAHSAIAKAEAAHV